MKTVEMQFKSGRVELTPWHVGDDSQIDWYDYTGSNVYQRPDSAALRQMATVLQAGRGVFRQDRFFIRVERQPDDSTMLTVGDSALPAGSPILGLSSQDCAGLIELMNKLADYLSARKDANDGR